MEQFKVGDFVSLKGQPDVKLTITKIEGKKITSVIFSKEKGFVHLESQEECLEKVNLEQ